MTPARTGAAQIQLRRLRTGIHMDIGANRPSILVECRDRIDPAGPKSRQIACRQSDEKASRWKPR